MSREVRGYIVKFLGYLLWVLLFAYNIFLLIKVSGIIVILFGMIAIYALIIIPKERILAEEARLQVQSNSKISAQVWNRWKLAALKVIEASVIALMFEIFNTIRKIYHG